MDGQPTGDKERDKLIGACAKDAYQQFFKDTKLDYEYCDAQDREMEVRLGIEPAYMYESLKMISIRREKRLSQLTTGYAWGPWGSGIRRREKYYSDYKHRGKFVRFVDKWHPLLYAGDASA